MLRETDSYNTGNAEAGPHPLQERKQNPAYNSGAQAGNLMLTPSNLKSPLSFGSRADVRFLAKRFSSVISGGDQRSNGTDPNWLIKLPVGEVNASASGGWDWVSQYPYRNCRTEATFVNYKNQWQWINLAHNNLRSSIEALFVRRFAPREQWRQVTFKIKKAIRRKI